MLYTDYAANVLCKLVCSYINCLRAVLPRSYIHNIILHTRAILLPPAIPIFYYIILGVGIMQILCTYSVTYNNIIVTH